MKVKSIIFCSGILLAFGCSQASSQEEATQAPPVQKPCQEPEFRQLDFWVGVWDLEWDNADGTKGTGTNTITNSPYGDCVITENFDGTPSLQFKGMSVSTYQKTTKL